MTPRRKASPESTIRQTILTGLGHLGWTQNDLATVARLSPAFISDVVGGRRRVGPTTALRLDAALGVPWFKWLELQREADQRQQAEDIARLREEMADELAGIALTAQEMDR